MDGGRSFLTWLGKKAEQTLYKRQALSLFLQMLLNESQENFTKIVRETLCSSDVRFHIKHLVLEILGQSRNISSCLAKLLDDLIEDPLWSEQLLKTSIIGKPILAKYLLDKDIVLTWASSGDEAYVNKSLWLANSVIASLPDAVEKLFRVIREKKLVSLDKLYGYLNYNLIEDSDSFFLFRLDLIRAGAQVHFVDWKVLVNDKPKRALALLKLLSELQIKVRDAKKNNEGCRFYGNDLTEILHLSRREYHLVWEMFLDFAVDSLRRYNDREYYSRYSSFDIEKEYTKQNTELNDFLDLSILLVIEAGKKYPQEHLSL